MPKIPRYVVVTSLPRTGGGYLTQRSIPLKIEEVQAEIARCARERIRATYEPANDSDFAADKKKRERRRDAKKRQMRLSDE